MRDFDDCWFVNRLAPASDSVLDSQGWQISISVVVLDGSCNKPA